MQFNKKQDDNLTEKTGENFIKNTEASNPYGKQPRTAPAEEPAPQAEAAQQRQPRRAAVRNIVLLAGGNHDVTDAEINRDAYIVFQNVSKRYVVGEVTINAASNVNFSIEKGEFAAILGASGAGKTTVLNILGGIDTANEGDIVVNGKLVSKLNESQLIQYRRNDIGFVFQFYNLIPNLTARENVELAAQISKSDADIDAIMRNVGLEDRMNNFPAQLSGGEQQRVAIARALAKKPKLLLCDEPTGALDYATGKKILGLLQKTCREEGMTVVLITHNSAIAPMADRVIRMKSGGVTEILGNNNPAAAETLEW